MMPLDGYPAPPGNKLECVHDLNIGGAYTAITAATPPTGGITVNAATFGLQYIEWAQTVGSDNGQYDGICYLSPLNASKPSKTFQLQIIVAATGAEASGTINSARTMRLYVKGY